MDLYEVADQIVKLLQQRGRLTYRVLKLQFKLDDDTLEAIKEELLYAQPQVVDDEGKGLIWTGETVTQLEPESSPQPALPSEHEPVQPTQVEPPTPDAERRQLTVMFCDLADSTKLSSQLDPEDLRDVIRAYQSTSAGVIERYNGYIAQHLGDGLMVYFGWPQAHEDDAQRAVHAGLGILEAMAGLNDRLEQANGIRLAVRIGIHTGLVVVGEIGQGARQEHLALGETPNIASRIEGVAAPDTVAMSATTFQLVEGYFTCQDLGQHDLKGIAEPMRVHRVLGDSGAQGRLDIVSARGLTPLVGREQEVGLLLERWQQVKEGQGQVVLLSGEAGIGKSRLLQVMKDHVASEAPVLLECRSSPYYQNTALYPITDLLQRILRWQRDDSPEQRLTKLEQVLRQYRLALEESVPLLASLLTLPLPEDRYPPLNLSPQRQRQKTLESILSILLEQAEKQRVLFILEDLHWTDPTTLELLDQLIDQVPTAPLYTLLTCRPTFRPAWSHRSYLTEMTVSRLSQQQIERLAEQVAGGKKLPEQVLRQIIEKTDGVPLFVEEMTKAVLETGALKEVKGQYKLLAPLTSLTIPSTLQDSLMARLDRLVTAKAVAQYAAVIGRQFSYALLQAVSQLDRETLQRELSRLVATELLYQRGLSPQATYTFKHALIQDIAYQSLLKSTRQQYHQRIAQVLVEQFPETHETQPELLAHHFTEAGLNASAIDYWHKAGQKAVQRSAHVEAISHLTRGMELLTTLPEAPERDQQELILQTALGPALMATTGYSSAEVASTYARARTLCQQMEDTPQLFQVLVGLRLFYLNRGEIQTAYELAEQLLTVAQRHDNPSHVMEAHRALGTTLSTLGSFSQAREQLELGIALHDDPQYVVPISYPGGADPMVICLSRVAEVLWFLGYPDQSLARSHEARSLAWRLSHPFSRIRALGYAIRLYLFRREEQAVRELQEMLQTLQDEQGLPAGLLGLTMQHPNEESVAELRQSLEAWQGLNQPHGLAILAGAYGQAGQHEAGLNAVSEALLIVKKMGERWCEAELHRIKGELLRQQSPDNQTEVEICYQQALSVARPQQAKSWELRAATSLARLWQAQGKRQVAYDLLAPVYEWFTEGFDTADLQAAKTLLIALR